MERRLYEAAVSGDVLTLNTLIQEDELILDRLSLTRLSETPLHIAALRGHLEFTRALLKRKPKLATELDSLGHSPLHLASAEGHDRIVTELLKVNPDACKMRDQNGRIPLHLACMRGRVEVIRELVRAQPDSVYDKLDPPGDSVLHLCVMYTHLDALDFLLHSVEDENFVKSTDSDRNTILHLAIALRQIETLKYIISSVAVVEELASTKNANGFTALDVLEQCPRDFKVMIQELLRQAGVQRDRKLENEVHSMIAAESSIAAEARKSPSDLDCPRDCWGKIRRILRMLWRVYIKTDHDWVENARGNLITTAALTATVAFQAAINPPGGVWQDNNGHEAGTSILATKFGQSYCQDILSYNTVSLFSSMSIIILMISGVPLKNRVSLGLLAIAMCSAVACMAVTYLNSLPMLTPDSMTPDSISPNSANAPDYEIEKLWRYIYGIYFGSFYTWVAICAVVLLRLAVWLKLKPILPKNLRKWWPFRPRSTNQNRPVVREHSNI